MDTEKPSIASEAREFLVALHLDLSEELQQQQASVRATLIMCADPAAHLSLYEALSPLKRESDAEDVVAQPGSGAAGLL